jgi:hypothetical protein
MTGLLDLFDPDKKHDQRGINIPLGLLSAAAGAFQGGPQTGDAIGGALGGGLGFISQMQQQRAKQQKLNQPKVMPAASQLIDPRTGQPVGQQVPFRPSRPPSMPEVIKLQGVLSQLPPGHPARPSIEARIKKLTAPPQSLVTINQPSPAINRIIEKADTRADVQRGIQENAKLQMDLLDQGLRTGAIQPFVTSMSGYLKDIFPKIKINPNLAGAEAFRALSNQAALRLRNPESGLGLTGNTSDRDLTFLKQSVANLGQTPEANRILLIVAQAKARREMALSEMKRDMLHDNKGFKGFGQAKKAYIESNSIFTDEEKAQIKQLAGGAGTPMPTQAPAAKTRRYNPETGKIE